MGVRGGRERERKGEGERELADLNDPITDNVGAVVSLLVSGHGLDLCLLHLFPTQTKNTEHKQIIEINHCTQKVSITIFNSAPSYMHVHVHVHVFTSMQSVRLQK